MAAVGGVAVAAQVLILIDTRDASVDAAVTGLVVAGATAAVGLLVATALSTPRRLVVPVEEAAGGPRLAGVALAVLVAAADGRGPPAVSRPLGSTRPRGQATGGSLGDALAAGRTADAHPPLIDGLRGSPARSSGPATWRSARHPSWRASPSSPWST